MSSAAATPPKKTESPRRHDLDALRAIAMLLGIVLHGILTFCPEFLPWPVHDSKTSELWFMPFAVIHGFRMPLFFLVSGFFTMMLFRKRGLMSLLWHRIRRILFPLLLGLVTIVPLGHWVNEVVMQSQVQGKVTESNPEELFWKAVFEGDAGQVVTQLQTGKIDINAQQREFGSTPLNIAALYGHLEVMKALIESGADVDAANRDKNASIHTGGFNGNYEAYRILKEAGVDVEKKNGDGSTVRSNCQLDWNITKAIAGMIRLPLNRERVEAGRKKILADLDGKRVEDARTAEPSKKMSTKQTGPSLTDWFSQKVFDPSFLLHLWFLWSLFLLVVAFSILVGIGKLVGFGLKLIPRWLLMPPVCLIWLIPLTVVAEVNMTPVFGPDTAAGLIPNFLLLAYYGLFFGYGAIYFHCEDEQQRFGWWWFLLIPVALFLVYPIASSVLYAQWEGHRWAAAALESVYVWLMIFGSMGFFKMLLSRESKVMRYVSDSSYWLYVAHLPLVIWLQSVVQDWEISSFAKAIFIFVVVSATLLITYQIFVRHTPIGWLLNGKRKKVA